jgi:lipoate-protein ligase A
MIYLLSNAGITGIEQKGISDLALNNRKILGSSIYIGTRPELYYYQSSLIINSNLGPISRYLLHPPREPDYRMNRPHDQFCTSLALEGFNTDPEIIRDLFSKHLQNRLSISMRS